MVTLNAGSFYNETITVRQLNSTRTVTVNARVNSSEDGKYITSNLPAEKFFSASMIEINFDINLHLYRPNKSTKNTLSCYVMIFITFYHIMIKVFANYF